MGWTKREPVGNLVVLGDDEGQVEKVGGLLAALTQDTMYPGRNNYELVQRNGESVTLAGCASLSRQIGLTDIGHFIKCQFKGWGKSANGKFKDIEVLIWNDEPTAEMRAWPRYAEVQPELEPKKKKAKKDEAMDDFPAALNDSSDDLPFD
jgi:hypothetical protein